MAPFFSAHGAGTGDGPASPGGDAPPIFFLKHQKENAPCTVEKKKCSAQNRRLWRLFCLNAGVVRIHAAETCQAPAGCAVPQRNRERAPRIWYCAAAFRGGHRKGFTISPALPASLSAPPSIPGGESKGEGPQPLPFEPFQGGVGETGEAPPAADEASLFRGSGAIGGPEKGPGIAMPRRC